jgi:hypothetical protein
MPGDGSCSGRGGGREVVAEVADDGGDLRFGAPPCGWPFIPDLTSTRAGCLGSGALGEHAGGACGRRSLRRRCARHRRPRAVPGWPGCTSGLRPALLAVAPVIRWVRRQHGMSVSGTGASATSSKPCGTKPRRPGSPSSSLTSGARPPPAPPAPGGSASPPGETSPARTAGTTGTATWSRPPTSPPATAAEPSPHQPTVRGSRTAEPAITYPVSTRPDVTPDAGPHHGQHPGSTWPALARPATQPRGVARPTARSPQARRPPRPRRTYGQVH